MEAISCYLQAEFIGCAETDQRVYVYLQDLVPVSAPLFRQRLSNRALTFRDILRLFHRHGDLLTDDDVDDMIVSLQLERRSQHNSLSTLLRTKSSARRNADFRPDELLLGLRFMLLFIW